MFFTHKSSYVLNSGRWMELRSRREPTRRATSGRPKGLLPLLQKSFSTVLTSLGPPLLSSLPYRPSKNNPSARWFLKQFDCPTALSWTELESKVSRRKPDLIFQKRIEGVFMEPFELQDFPLRAFSRIDIAPAVPRSRILRLLLHG